MTIPNSQFPPIPPPPYSSSMSAPHTELLHRNDPFLRRRPERDHRRASSPTIDQPRTYIAATTSHYKPTPLAGLQLSSAQDAPVQSGQDMSYGTGNDARYQAQTRRGTSDERASSMVVLLATMRGNTCFVALIFHPLAFSSYQAYSLLPVALLYTSRMANSSSKHSVALFLYPVDTKEPFQRHPSLKFGRFLSYTWLSIPSFIVCNSARWCALYAVTPAPQGALQWLKYDTCDIHTIRAISMTWLFFVFVEFRDPSITEAGQGILGFSGFPAGSLIHAPAAGSAVCLPWRVIFNSLV